MGKPSRIAPALALTLVAGLMLHSVAAAAVRPQEEQIQVEALRSWSGSLVPDFFLVLQFLVHVDDLALNRPDALERFLEPYRVSSSGETLRATLLEEAATTSMTFSQRLSADQFASAESYALYQRERLRELAAVVAESWALVLQEVQASGRDPWDFMELLRADMAPKVKVAFSDSSEVSFLKELDSIFTVTLEECLAIAEP